MTGLLDTHTFLWAAMRPGKLSPQVRAIILDMTNSICVSAVTFWEVALKFSLGKIEL
jgi:PIN domain nuclease of toxin-antitoxin system